MSDRLLDGLCSKRPDRPGQRWHVRAIAFLVATAGIATGCEVTNPGPIQDEFLSDEPSHAPLVMGAHRKIVEGLNNLAYHTGVVAREIFPSGETTGGATPQIQGGQLLENQTNAHWADIQQARFIAEDAIQRFTASGVTVNPALLTEAYIWAGHANRILGENWCQVTFDRGPALPSTAAFERAEDHFSNAIQRATTDELRLAAYAGRAQARLGLKKWSLAASDAAQVPVDFRFVALTDGNEIATRNNVYWSKANTPYRFFSMHFTSLYDYYLQARDPRVAWKDNPAVPFSTSSLQGYGQVPWSYPVKYNGVDAPYNLASGQEMILIRAEAALAQNQIEQGINLINQVRTSYRNDQTNAPLVAYTATTAAEAWTALMAERSYELFLEGRRLFDIRRWEEAGVPGNLNLPDFETRSHIFQAQPFSRCFPISQTERLTNPNLS